MRACFEPIKWKCRGVAVVVLLVPPLLSPEGRGQDRAWTIEAVDRSGEYAAITSDGEGNLHISYVSEKEKVKYAYRPAESPRWFTMPLDTTEAWGGVPTKITLDSKGNPHFCYTPGMIKYAFFNGRKWNIQRIAPQFGQKAVHYDCSVAIAPDGTPHLSWYHYENTDGSYYLHVRYAVLREGAWLTQTIDFEPATGKWNSLAVDGQGNPHLVYSSYGNGYLKYAYWKGGKWNLKVVDSRNNSSQNPGLANAIVLNRDGKVQISYEDEKSLRYAWPRENSWLIQTVDSITPADDYVTQRTHQVLDRQGFPHIAYEDSGAVKHAYWDGSEWHVQVISPSGPDRERFSDIAIDGKDTLYITYRDASDGSLKVAVGRLAGQTQSTAAQKSRE